MWPLPTCWSIEERRLVGEFGHDARVAGGDADGLEEFDVVPVVVLDDGGMRGIEPGDGLKTLAFPAGVTGGFDAFVGDGNLHAGHRHAAEGDEHGAAAAYIRLQFVFESGGQGADIGEHDEGVFGGAEVGSLFGAGGIDLEGGLAGRLERRFEVEEAAGVVGVVDEEGAAGVGAFDGEIVGVVGGKGIGRIDADFAFVAAVGHVEREEFDGGEAVFGDLDGFAFDGAAVEPDGHVAGGFAAGAVSGDGDEHAGLLVVVNAAGGDHVFDGEVGGGCCGDRVRLHADGTAALRRRSLKFDGMPVCCMSEYR